MPFSPPPPVEDEAPGWPLTKYDLMRLAELAALALVALMLILLVVRPMLRRLLPHRPPAAAGGWRARPAALPGNAAPAALAAPERPASPRRPSTRRASSSIPRRAFGPSWSSGRAA